MDVMVGQKSKTGGRRRIAVFDPAAFREQRLAAGVSVNELGRLADVTSPAIRAWESGKSQPSAVAYGRVLNVLLDAEEGENCPMCQRRRRQ